MYRYRITVERISPNPDTAPATSPALQFETENHDDIIAIAIASRMNGRFDLDESSSASLAIGMKLFAEIVLKNRTREPFSEIRPAMATFIQAIKAARQPA